MQISTRKKDIIWNYLGIFFSLGSQVIWLPVLIHYLPPDILGLWYVFVSVGALVELMDSGFTPTLNHCISYAWSGAADLKKYGVSFSKDKNEPNYALTYAILSTCRRLYFFIALVASFFMATLGTCYIERIAEEYLSWQIYAAWVVYILSTFINLYIGYYSVVLTGIGDVFHDNKANIASKGALLLFGTISLTMGYGILGLSISYFISGFVKRFLCKYYLIHLNNFGKLFHTFRNQQIYSKKHILSMMWPNAWRDGLVTVSFYLTGQVNVLLCSNFLTLYETGIYSFSLQVINAIIRISYGMFNAYIPAIQSAYVSRKKSLMKNLYSKSIACAFYLSSFGIFIFVIIGIPVVGLLRSDFIIEKDVFIVMSISIYLMSRHRNSAAFIATMNKLPYTFSFILFAVISAIFTYISLAYFNCGIWGLVIIPLLVQSVYNNWKWNQVVNHYLRTTEINLIKAGTKSLISIISSRFKFRR